MGNKLGRSDITEFILISYISPRIKLIKARYLLLFLILSLTFGNCLGELYNFEGPSGDILRDTTHWTINGNWKITTDNYHPSNSYLTSGIIECGRMSFSTELDGPCTITFDWKKIGEYGNLRCYYDNNFDPNNICRNYGWTHGSIYIPVGHHIVTWDFIVGTCSGIGNVADIDNINVPCLVPYIPKIYITQDENQSSIAKALKAPSYEVEVASEADLQTVINNSESKVLYLDGRFKGPINITVDNIKLRLGDTRSALLDGNNKPWNIGMDNRTNVSIEGLHLKNSLNGIKMEKCSRCRISGNSIEFSNGSGICLRNSTDTNIIEYNDITSIDGHPNNVGICLHHSNDNKLTNNRISVPDFCISLEHSYGNVISLLNNDKIYDNGTMCRVNNCRIECVHGVLNDNTWSSCME